VRWDQNPPHETKRASGSDRDLFELAHDPFFRVESENLTDLPEPMDIGFLPVEPNYRHFGEVGALRFDLIYSRAFSKQVPSLLGRAAQPAGVKEALFQGNCGALVAAHRNAVTDECCGHKSVLGVWCLTTPPLRGSVQFAEVSHIPSE
jgi:hypothetical protein